ncbi:MAG: hypothetical protein KJN97_18525 [Deltaproteobacteria bacterium]|nr:hypothetical protein [Deltaproteobacteria bacterium]
MFGLLESITLALLALLVVGAGVVGAILWLIARWMPALAGLLFVASLLLTAVTVYFGILVFVDTVFGDWVGPTHPIYTVGVPGACGFLAFSTWKIWKIRGRRAGASR